MDLSFFRGKRVFITGHTGFKGSWMCKALALQGANIAGYALPAPTSPSLFELAGISREMTSIHGDIRDKEALNKALQQFKPDIVIHMAAQPLVRESYTDPVYTYETNAMGTVYICDAIKQCNSVRSFINVTTDKVYQNQEWEWGYRENDELNGFDPYSNSKSCSELITASYINSFFSSKDIAVSTCRAGNVIGGGDFAADRIIPDCVRAMQEKRPIVVRNPDSTRPYQHVLEPVFAYLTLAQKQYEDKSFASCYNIGPEDCDCVTTGALVELFCQSWGNGAVWRNVSERGAPHEATFLKLDCSKIATNLKWRPRWHIADAIDKTVEWSRAYLENRDIVAVMDAQINEYSEWVTK